MPTNATDKRVNRALAAYLRQEIQAPAIAVAEFLAIIIEDARRQSRDEMMSDLGRMHEASSRLNTFVNGLIESSSVTHHVADDEFYRRIRHDLRTPLNAIIGYSELLIEDMDGGEGSLLLDLGKLRDSAGRLLGQIDAMQALNRDTPRVDTEDAMLLRAGAIADVLRTVEAMRPSEASGAVEASDILVVDDNASNRDVLDRRLSREGHRVVTANNGEDALKLAEQNRFDLILLDLIMPEMSGFEALQRLKASPTSSHIPVIVISALDELDSVVRCIEAGADDYLTKPFDPVLLRARIHASLDRKHLRDREKIFIVDLEKEKRRSETLLLNILPQSIVQRMREGETAIADRVKEATILFCDLVGFTALSQELSADQVIDFLSQIFSTFDQLVAAEGVEKIKTIGDSYMVASGIPQVQADHAYRIARLSLRMMAAVSDIAEKTGLNLKARIGINSGSVVAGVIGTHKFVYDVWGDTVNTASRMESHSQTGRIQVSAVTRYLLGDSFQFEPRGMIEIKGKAPMETYFLLGSTQSG